MPAQPLPPIKTPLAASMHVFWPDETTRHPDEGAPRVVPHMLQSILHLWLLQRERSHNTAEPISRLDVRVVRIKDSQRRWSVAPGERDDEVIVHRRHER